MKLPILKNEEGDIVRPRSLTLHNNESQMLFTDKNDTSQIFNFDMEKGKIVEQFRADKDSAIAKLRHITNKIKNG